MSIPVKSTSFNTSLHGARGLAALMVVLSHIGVGGVTEKFFHEIPTPLIVSKYILLAGQYGVEIFFMISGYLITASIIRHETAVSFLVDRCTRLYPVFTPALLLIFVAGPFIGYSYFTGMSWIEWMGYLVINLAFIPGVVPIEAALIVAWSLSYEAVFYLALAFMKYFKDEKILIYLFLAFLALPFVILLPRALFFLVGIFIYYIVKGELTFSFRLPQLFSVNLIAFLSVLFTLQFAGDFNLILSGFSALLLWVASLVFGYLVFIEIVMKSPHTNIFFKWRWVQFLGTISYSLYIWHTLIMFGTKRIFSSYVPVFGEYGAFVMFAVVSIVLSIILSYVSYYLFEDKAVQWLRLRGEVWAKMRAEKKLFRKSK